MTTAHRARALLRSDDPARHFDVDDVDTVELRAIPTSHPAHRSVTPQSDQVTRFGSRRRWRPRREHVVAGGLIAITVGGTAAASGLLRPPHPEVFGITCVSADDSRAGVAYREGSPVETCRKVWQTEGIRIPADLVVYEAADKLVGVAPRTLVPAGAVVVAEPSGPDVRVLELADALADDSRGLSFTDVCHSETEVRAKVRDHLTRLGLSFRIEQTTGEGECAVAFLHPTEPSVAVVRRTQADIAQNAQGEQDPAGPDFQGFDRAVEALAVSPPTTLAEIRAAVASAAARHGVSADSYDISTVTTPVGTTPRLYVVRGGRLVLHVYLPTQ